MRHELDIGEHPRDRDAADANQPAHRARQPANMAKWRTDVAIAPGDMVPLRAHAVMRQLDTLDADAGMALVADVATAARAVMRVNVVREAGGRPLLWHRRRAANIAGEAGR